MDAVFANNLPNLKPIKIEPPLLLEHPQLLVGLDERVNLPDGTITVLPQSHLHSHNAPSARFFPTIAIAINDPNLTPDKSIVIAHECEHATLCPYFKDPAVTVVNRPQSQIHSQTMFLLGSLPSGLRATSFPNRFPVSSSFELILDNQSFVDYLDLSALADDVPIAT